MKSYQIHLSVTEAGSCSEVRGWDGSLLFPLEPGAGFAPNLPAVAVLSLHSGHNESREKPKLGAAPLLACTTTYTLENTPNFNEWGNKKPGYAGFSSVDFWKVSERNDAQLFTFFV